MLRSEIQFMEYSNNFRKKKDECDKWDAVSCEQKQLRIYYGAPKVIRSKIHKGISNYRFK